MKITILQGHHIQATKGTRLATEEEKAADSSVEQVDTWTMVFTDGRTHDQIQIAFERDARDELVRQLTSGIVLSGGEFPKV